MSREHSAHEAQEARTKLVSDWLFLSHSMRNCADSINRFLAGSNNQADFLQNIVQLPNLHAINPSEAKDLPMGGTGTGSSKKKRARSAADDEDEKPKKVKKEKKEKDPNAPKRPASAYIIFQNQIRQKMRDEHPEMAYKDIVTKISEQWAGLDAEEKKRYQDAASSEMAKWKNDSEEYKKTGIAPTAAVAEDEDDDDEDAPAAAAVDNSTSTDESDDSDEEGGVRRDLAPVPPVKAAAVSKKPKAVAAPAPAAPPTPVGVKSSQSKKKSKKAAE